MDEAKLKERLWRLQLDCPDSALPFSRRLARENGWSHAFALRAIEEYRRFVLLAMVAGHPITPSDEVDQVWHLHLCYTRSYWDEMCGEVLGKPLHHGPTRGGHAEVAKFDDWYRSTLHSYQRIFGEQPPQDVWPASEQRFSPRRWRRVDVAGTWLVSQRKVKRQLLAAGSLVVLLAASSCSDMFGDGIGGTIAILATLGVVGLVVMLLKTAANATRDGGTAKDREDGTCGGDGGYHGTHDRHDVGGHSDDDGGGGGDGGGGCGGGCGD